MNMIITSLLVFLLVGVVFLVVKSKSVNLSNDNLIKELKDSQERIERSIRDEIARNRKENMDSSRQAREELSNMLDKVRGTVQERLDFLQKDNSQKLDDMRKVVDEKLHTALEKRLGESFKMVSDRLESVYKGLGEMRGLASDVGDLKKVLTNVKTRGTWGEIQLGALLEQILTSDQYESNVITKRGSNERVEFAIKLPGKEIGSNDTVWLPIDAKFPQEDYQRLLSAQESADTEGVEKCAKQLEIRIKAEAKDIKEKYLDPPNTPDFGLMFLPTEGLYAEILRRPGLVDILQREFRVVVTGPTTLAAILNSLQMGFRTLAIEQRSSEVWRLLGMVKTEFSKFGDILDKTKKKLQEAANTIDNASSKSRNIERKLKKVQQLPSSEEFAIENINDIDINT